MTNYEVLNTSFMKKKEYVKPEVTMKEVYSEDCFVTASQFVNVGGSAGSFSIESQVTETKNDDSWVFDSPQF